MAGDQPSAVQLLSAWPSPYVMRAEMALVLKKVSYAKVPQDLANKSEVLLQSNPVYKKVPVLLHHGKPVCESSIIVQYVDEAFPSPSGINLLPSDPYERAICRFWGDYVDKKLFDGLYGLMRLSAEEDLKAGVENVMGVLSTLEGALGSLPTKEEEEEAPFFGGANPGYVDVMMAPLLVWLSVFEAITGLDTLVPQHKFPRLASWFTHAKAHPIAAALPEPAKLIDFVYTVILKRPRT